MEHSGLASMPLDLNTYWGYWKNGGWWLGAGGEQKAPAAVTRGNDATWILFL